MSSRKRQRIRPVRPRVYGATVVTGDRDSTIGNLGDRYEDARTALHMNLGAVFRIRARRVPTAVTVVVTGDGPSLALEFDEDHGATSSAINRRTNASE
jgi:hypothetical protein